MKNTSLITAVVACSLAAATTSSAASIISTLDLDDGNTILQVTNAVPNNNPGGQATADTRTLYVFEPDFGDLANADPLDDGPDFTGTTWPWVYDLDAGQVGVDDLVIEDGITATFDLVTNPNSGAGLQWLFVNGNPTYQFINDNSPDDFNGNFGPWNFLEIDGTPTQNTIPEPSSTALLIGGLVAAMAGRRRFRKH